MTLDEIFAIQDDAEFLETLYQEHLDTSEEAPSEAADLVSEFMLFEQHVNNGGVEAYFSIAAEIDRVRGWLVQLGDDEGLAIWDRLLAIVDRADGEDIHEKLEEISDDDLDEADEVASEFLDAWDHRAPKLAAYVRARRAEFRDA